MYDFLTKNFKWLVILVLVVAGLLVSRSCRVRELNEDIAKLKSDVEQGEKTLLERDERIAKLIEDHDKAIAELNGNIDSANTVISGYIEQDATLKKKLAALNEAVGSIANKDDLIANLTEKVFLWESRFNLAEKTIAEKDRIIFSLTQEYESERKLRILISEDRDAWKTQYSDLKVLCDKLELEVVHSKKRSLYTNIAVGLLAGTTLLALAK